MSTEKLDALIIRNLSDLDTAAKRLYDDIQIRIAKAIDDIVESWTKKCSWVTTSTFHKDEIIYIAPPEWKSPDPQDADNWLAWFAFEPGSGDNIGGDDATSYFDTFWLTRLCGVGHGMLCFRWHYGAEALGVTKPKWKKFVQVHIQRIVEKTGFTYEDSTGCFFNPLRVDSEKLAVAIEEDAAEDALQPIRDALDQLLAATPEFDALLKDAKKHFIK